MRYTDIEIPKEWIKCWIVIKLLREFYVHVPLTIIDYCYQRVFQKASEQQDSRNVRNKFRYVDNPLFGISKENTKVFLKAHYG